MSHCWRMGKLNGSLYTAQGQSSLCRMRCTPLFAGLDIAALYEHSPLAMGKWGHVWRWAPFAHVCVALLLLH